MRLVVDLQAAQSADPNRAAHALEFARALVLRRGAHDIIVALSALRPETIEPLRLALGAHLSPDRIVVWQAPGPVCASEPANEWRRGCAEQLREAALAALAPDLILVTHPWPGAGEEAVASVAGLASATPLVLTLYADQCLDDSMRHTLCRVRGALAFGPAALGCAIKGLGLPPDCVMDLSGPVLEAAARALALAERLHAAAASPAPPAARRPRLAYVSPLPPARSGIADFSAMLLPHLAAYYEIDAIVDQDEHRTALPPHCHSLRRRAWFEQHADEYERILYHFGNSPVHAHMVDLVERQPGVVVLHDFFLGDLSRCTESLGQRAYAWALDLYEAHGYAAVADRFRHSPSWPTLRRYPCNTIAIGNALGVVVHSNNARVLARRWYGPRADEYWATIPLLRAAIPEPDRAAAREILGVPHDSFLVCSFGLINPFKSADRLLDVWHASPLAADPHCRLVFIGDNDGGDYGRALRATLTGSLAQDRIHITGWVDAATFGHWLAAADLGVQLRSADLGETSAAVLDCMNHGLPTIANAIGSMAELPADAVCLLPEDYTDQALTDTLTGLWRDAERRAALGGRARATVIREHDAGRCAALYRDAIERAYVRGAASRRPLAAALARMDQRPPSAAALAPLARAIAANEPRALGPARLYVDVSTVCGNDLKTGIQRVLRAILAEWLSRPPEGYRVEPVYLSAEVTAEGTCWHYRHARRFTLQFLECPRLPLQDDVIEPRPGDLLVGPDFAGFATSAAEQAGLYRALRAAGVALHFVVYDLLPVLLPHAFPAGGFGFERWLGTVSRCGDNLIAISQAVADDLRAWLAANPPARSTPLRVGAFHLGADMANTAPTTGLPPDAGRLQSMLRQRPTLLMVGTIEPRKGHAQTLAAFDLLWRRGVDVNLAIAGREGWQNLPNLVRRNIPEVVAALRTHPERGSRLFWFEDASDEWIEALYASATCLLMPSEGEGFGLPLIEAARHGTPLLVRDLPVFREIAGPHTAYFQGFDPSDLATAITQWLADYGGGTHPRSDKLPWLTWKQSAAQLWEQVQAATAVTDRTGRSSPLESSEGSVRG